jgi:hypothetical protein
MKIFKMIFWLFSQERADLERKQLIQKNCKHEHWNCDNQIRVIVCKNCGLKAVIDDYVDLYR